MTTPCKIAGCTRNVYCRGLCAAHYNRLLAGRPLEGPIRPKRPSGPPRNKGSTASPHRNRVASGREAIRTCLACRRPFDSEGPWNHICRTCRARPEADAGRKPRHRVHGLGRDPERLLENS